MALGTTDISTTLIRNTLAESTNSVFSLCTSSLINKWSRFKPIRDAGAGVNRPGGDGTVTAGRFGLNIYDDPPTWDYLQPRGGAPGGAIDEPGRLGDFKEYEHNALPPFELVVYPGAAVTSNQLIFGIVVNEDDITIEDLIISDWYFAIKIGSIAYSAEQPLSERDDHFELPDVPLVAIVELLSSDTINWEAGFVPFISVGGAEIDTWLPMPAYDDYVISGTTVFTYDAGGSSEPVTFDVSAVWAVYGDNSVAVIGVLDNGIVSVHCANFVQQIINLNFSDGNNLGSLEVPASPDGMTPGEADTYFASFATEITVTL